MVPSASIQTGPDGSYVFVVKSDNTVEVRPVKVSFTQNNMASIASGLKCRRYGRDGRPGQAAVWQQSGSARTHGRKQVRTRIEFSDGRFIGTTFSRTTFA